MSIHIDTLRSIKQETGCSVLFETGLSKGAGVARALALGFEEIYSIELLEKFVDAGNAKFSEEISQGRVHIIPDDSANISKYLPGLINKKVLFFFDAHLDNGLETASTTPESNCPILKEILALSIFNIKPVVIVDDMRVIRGDYRWGLRSWGDSTGGHGLADEKKVIKAIRSLPFDYEINFLDSVPIDMSGVEVILKNDLLVAK